MQTMQPVAAERQQTSDPLRSDEGQVTSGTAGSSRSEGEVPGYEESLAELEAAWVRAMEEGEISQDELEYFRSVFRSGDASKALEEAWDEIANQEDAWSREWDPISSEVQLLEGGLLSDHLSPPYQFADDNKFLQEKATEDGVDLLDTALDLLRQNRTLEAIAALEAKLKVQPYSSEGWRMLGQIHAENEQDSHAIRCLQRGHDIDPFNLASLLSLGVSLTNELDAPQAIRHLWSWLSHHEHFHSLPGLREVTALVNGSGRFGELRTRIGDLFHAAVLLQPDDPEAHEARGVSLNISRDYAGALDSFAEALKLRSRQCENLPVASTAHFKVRWSIANLWNKLGATFANSAQSAQAITAYHQALALRPHYARAWANLGIAHSNIGHNSDALRFHLSALNLNKDALHLWHYVRASLPRLPDNPQLKAAAKQESVEACKAAGVEVVGSNSLPAGKSRIREADVIRTLEQLLPGSQTTQPTAGM